MLTEGAMLEVGEFLARKQAQWDKFSAEAPNLGLIKSGPHKTQWMIYLSTDTFYEGVIIGQLPQKVPRAIGRGPHKRMVDTTDAAKPIEKRGIDLNDTQIRIVLRRWADEKSAADLEFVHGVWGRDGKMRTA